MKKLKLYVWEDCLTDYTDGVMFALASSEDEAREQILKSCNYVPPGELAVQPKIIDSPIGYAIWGGG